MSPENQKEIERIRDARSARLAQIEQHAHRLLCERGEVCASDVSELLIDEGWSKSYARAMVRRHLRRLVSDGELGEGELRLGPKSRFPRRYFTPATERASSNGAASSA